ncbi:DegV family protein [Rummeliibacillus stabekisii]|uniref:Fatty acid-binding protein DegV n=1 Tax=Rummeliibacillus stabekisii TaxID=241244 RepID=A0A143H8Q7_9BACL|nr:DegV family protein [Rummeliibacillus stabekisii]AMW98127.1 fatty acid-binding protein DegV [Rummeliibacillus stabekisii]
MTTAIVTDSTAYLSEDEIKDLNIHVVPLSVIFEGESYEEGVDLDVGTFYKKVREEKELPKTSQPPIGKFVSLFEKLAKDYDEVVTIHLSSGISGTYQGAVQAGEMVKNLDVHGFDSEIACYVQGFYVIEAGEMAKQGASAKEIIAKLEEVKKTVRAYFMVDDLAHLQRGGRLSAASALIGGLLQVKPILHFQDKVIVPFEKIRTRKKALKRIEDLLCEDVSVHPNIKASVIHGNCEEEGKEWMRILQEKYPSVEFTLSYFGPVIGTHLGEGSLGLGWYRK